ncbi:peroxidase family protein [Caldimonas brevitalea]|uniref:Myeloperoxidase, thyroid peroxidase, cyclooxygenase catalytic domain n=1 Tax=Caldimonas brevitalea TaxID=413882 RepID=A0A0G3BSA1_9BURK|nr:heme peroxidase family protein [Caldimonas brevitalea]AKJ29430.1 myeloperoxidase, thyroid peroxidase, cyclooxygenase catalytic domain [Caldimonas brevitalea]
MEWKQSCLLSIVVTTMACQSVFGETVNARFPREAQDSNNKFIRMFPNLEAFSQRNDRVRNAVRNLGAKNGLLDAQDNMTDPVQSITNQPVFSPLNLDNPKMTAGVTFFGQFLDHDLTLDLRSKLQEKTGPSRTVNFRTAAFDLDSLYGEGPDRSPELYVQSDTDIKFKIEPIPGSEAVSRKGAQRFDMPREPNGDAIIADSRNDENLILSQFHLAMLRFHNAVTDHLKAQQANRGLSPRELFSLARRTVRWHYQWIILHEFLPLTIGQDRVDRIMRGGLRFFENDRGRQQAAADRDMSLASREDREDDRGRRDDRDRRDGRRNDCRDDDRNDDRNDRRDHQARHRNGNDDDDCRRPGPQIPVEFSVAAYRFGHSQVRPSYRANFGPDQNRQFFAFILDERQDPGLTDPEDLRGGRRAPRRFIDWQTFFNFGDGNVRQNKIIDTKISTVLMEMPGARAPLPGLPDDGVQSLPSRNMMRHVNFGLPSGQAIARRMNEPALTREQLKDLAPFDMAESTPLWFYVLREAEVMEAGLRLGPVGSRIVGEVFIGLLRADRTSFLASSPQWKPNLPSAGGPGTFQITDLLKFAGVVPPLQ